MTKKTKRVTVPHARRLMAIFRSTGKKMVAELRKTKAARKGPRKARGKVRNPHTRPSPWSKCQGCFRRKPYLCPLGCGVCDTCCPGHDREPAGDR